MGFKPVELFVLCDSYEQALAKYEEALNTLYELGKNGIRRSEIGKLDKRYDALQFFMTRFGFKVFRVVYGEQHELDGMRWMYSIQQTVKAEDIDIKEFITNYISMENVPVETSEEHYPINISIPVPNCCTYMPMDIWMKFIDELEKKKLYYVRNKDTSYFVDIEVENIARIRFYYGDDSCTNLLTSAYRGDIMTYARFIQDYKKLATRILRMRNKNTRAS